MHSILEIISAIASPLLILLVGGFCRRSGWMRVEADASLSILTVRVLYPCFFFFHLVGNQESLPAENLLFVLVAGFVCISVGFACAYIVATSVGIQKKIVAPFTFCSGIFNYGFFAFPVATSIFGEQIIAKIILFNLGVETAIWTLGIWIIASSRFKLTRLVNPPIISIVLSILVKEIGGEEVVPQFAWEIISLLGGCAIPIGLLLIGGNFADLISSIKLSDGKKIGFSAILVRLFVVPLIMFCYAMFGPIPTGMDWLRDILLIQLAMPAGIFAIVIIKNYERDTDTAMIAILSTMVGCLVSTPIWLLLGIKLLN